MNITLTVPDQYLVDYEPSELAKRIKLYAALRMFQSKELSAAIRKNRIRSPDVDYKMQHGCYYCVLSIVLHT